MILQSGNAILDIPEDEETPSDRESPSLQSPRQSPLRTQSRTLARNSLRPSTSLKQVRTWPLVNQSSNEHVSSQQEG
jgi:hypothetical protein